MKGKPLSTPPLPPQIRRVVTQGFNLPRPRSLAILPPEILDKILEQIPTDGPVRRVLTACALVATWWVGPSQRRLFSSVTIHRHNYQRWMDGIVFSGPKIHLLEHVRSLWHARSLDLKLKHRMRDLPQDSGKYLSALPNLHSLTLYNTKVEHISEEGFRTCFSLFRGTLTQLSLADFATSFSAFVALVDYFPNLRTLLLQSFTLEPDEGPVPSLSRPLRGRIHVHQVSCLEFYNRFAKLDLEYEELVINPSLTSLGIAFLESALQISAGTVKCLKLSASLACK